MNDFHNVLAHYDNEMRKRREAALRAFATETVPQLAQAGVRRIDVQYSGYGDSGAVDNVDCYGDDDQIIPVERSLLDGVDSVVLELVPMGFENNDGGEGVLKLDLVKGSYHLHHGTRVMEVCWEDQEGKF
jgi:hypothetical protein